MKKYLASSLMLITIGVAPARAQNATSIVAVAPPTSDVVAEARNLPDRFDAVLDQWEKERADLGACPKIYKDPRDGTVLRLVRTTTSRSTTGSDADRVSAVLS